VSNHPHRRAQRRPRRPSAVVVDLAAASTALLLGCACRPDVGEVRHGPITSVTVAHDPDCPAADGGHVYSVVAS
jgi:hypothetical protein